MLRLRIFFLVALYATCATAVNRTVYKTCSQRDFCNRLRTKPPSQSLQLDVSNVVVKPNSILGAITNTETNEIITVNVTAYANNTFRVLFDEQSPRRYRLSGILDDSVQTVNFDTLLTHVDTIEIDVGDNKALLYASPFKIEFYKNGVLGSVINSRGLLTIEQSDGNIAIAVDVDFPSASRAYGIPEHADPLSLRTTSPDGLDPYRLYNLDVSLYEVNETMALYGHVPVLYSHGVNSVSNGVFLHNAAETWVEIDNGATSVNSYWMTETGVIDLFVFLGPTPQDAVRQYTTLTGTAPLPQYFTLGYHQSRWNYVSENDVKTVVANFDAFDFPLDVMWLDIEYTDNKKYFTWDPVNFPTPLDLDANLTATNRKLITILDPHIKVEPGYFVYDELLANGYFMKNPDGSVFEGDCWPGLSSYPDFLNPVVRQYYSDLYAFDRFVGSTENTYIWNDMNEPSVFNDTLEKTFPKDLVHYENVNHTDVHNIYGYLQTISTYEGMLKRAENPKRPFILTRSHFAGSQRYTGMWTGDNTADWSFLRITLPMCLAEAIAGFSICGSDVGGFFYDPDIELLQRWYQAGAWLTFYRAHANMTTERREPYLFEPDVQEVLRAAMKERYTYISMWYTLFWEHTQYKDPVVRPLFYHYPNDQNIIDNDWEALVGPNILVRPITDPGVTLATVYLPGQNEYWYNIDENLVYNGFSFYEVNITLQKIPVYFKSGSIIPRKMVERSSSVLMHQDPFTLYVYLNENNTADGTLYVDDNESFNYKNKEYTYVRFHYINDVLTINKIHEDADYPNANLELDSVVVYRLPTMEEDSEISTGVRKAVVQKVAINKVINAKKPVSIRMF